MSDITTSSASDKKNPVLVSKEAATEEISSWLDYKKISENKKDAQKDQIETLIEGMVEGNLELTEDHKLVQKLKWPVGSVSTLTYKPRLKLSEVHQKLAGVKSSDADGRVMAYVCALTGEAKGIIQGMDTEDYSIAQAIAIFFL